MEGFCEEIEEEGRSAQSEGEARFGVGYPCPCKAQKPLLV